MFFCTLLLASCGANDSDMRSNEMRGQLSRPAPVREQVSGQNSEAAREQDLIAADIALINESVGAPTPLTGPQDLSNNQGLASASSSAVSEYGIPPSVVIIAPAAQPAAPTVRAPTSRPAPANRPIPQTGRASVPFAGDVRMSSGRSNGSDSEVAIGRGSGNQALNSHCRRGETWTKMRDDSFACCPAGGASCYNPCESDERATRMRDSTFACCPADGAHCYPL